jgi:hypothetical protein
MGDSLLKGRHPISLVSNTSAATVKDQASEAE